MGGRGVTLSIMGEADGRKPSAIVCETDMDVVLRFDGVTEAVMGEGGAYKWNVTDAGFPVTNTTRFGNGQGNHQCNNCPAHLAHMEGSTYKNFWVVDEARGCVEIKVLKVDRERAREMDGGSEEFTWTRYDNGVWTENTHMPWGGKECGSDACRRRRAVAGGVGVDGHIHGDDDIVDNVAALLRRFCSDINNIGRSGTVAAFNAMLTAAYPTSANRIISNRRDNGVMRPECIVHGANMRSIPGVVEELVNGQKAWRVVGTDMA
jgi:hypothetical protein